MALFRILKGASSRIDLSATAFHDGYAYFTPDDAGFYIDSEDDGVQRRIRINPVYITEDDQKNSTVLYDEEQDLTEAQKTQALTNLGFFTQDTEPADAEVGTLWIDTSTEGGEGSAAGVDIPTPTTDDSGKFLRVDSSGSYVLEAIETAEEASF